MKISKELNAQLDRLQKTGSFSLGQRLKKELAALTVEHCLNPLVNLRCGVCVRNSMWDIIKKRDDIHKTPVLQKRHKMVKRIEDLTWSEIKQRAKDKGIKIHGKKKAQLIKELNEI